MFKKTVCRICLVVILSLSMILSCFAAGALSGECTHVYGKGDVNWQINEGKGTIYFYGWGTLPLGVTGGIRLPYYDFPIDNIVIGEGVETIGALGDRMYPYLYSDMHFNSIKIPTTLREFENVYYVDGFNSRNEIEYTISADHIYIADLPAWMNGGFGGKFRNYNLYLNGKHLKNLSVENLSTIRANAFSYCKSLKTVEIQNVPQIGTSAFRDCDALTEVVIQNVNIVDNCAFINCDTLNELTIQKVNKLKDSVFYGCTALEKATIWEGTTSIGYSAFNSCTNLSVVVLPKTIDIIRSNAFFNCPSITDVYYAGSEDSWAKIWIEGGNQDLLNANIHFGAQSCFDNFVAGMPTLSEEDAQNLLKLMYYSNDLDNNYDFSTNSMYRIMIGDVDEYRPHLSRLRAAILSMVMNLKSRNASALDATAELTDAFSQAALDTALSMLPGDATSFKDISDQIYIAHFGNEIADFGLDFLTDGADMLGASLSTEEIENVREAAGIFADVYEGIDTIENINNGLQGMLIALNCLKLKETQSIEGFHLHVNEYLNHRSMHSDADEFQLRYGPIFEGFALGRNYVNKNLGFDSKDDAIDTLNDWSEYIYEVGGYARSADKVNPAGGVTIHDLDEKTYLKAATCTEDGRVSAKCLNCGVTLYDTVPAHGHYDTYNEYENVTYGTHTVRVRCDICGTVVSTNTENCTDFEYINNRCDHCGGVMCPHTSKTATSTYNNDRTHTTVLKCADCNWQISTTTEYCEDLDFDQICDKCGSEVICWHNGTEITFKYTSKGNGRHTKTSTCQCGTTFSNISEMCEDDDNDDFCDLCGYEFVYIGDTGFSNSITHNARTLSLDGSIVIKQYLNIDGFFGVDITRNGGLLVFTSEVTEETATHDLADHNQRGLEYDSAKDRYFQTSHGIAAKEYGDTIYLRGYVIDNDGVCHYGDLMSYSVRQYCEGRLEKSSDQELKDVCISILHYGAAAQKYLDYKTENLANAGIADVYPSFEWNANYLDEVKTYTTNLPVSSYVNISSKSLSLDGSILINFYSTVNTITPDKIELLLWKDVKGTLTEVNVSEIRNMEYEEEKTRYRGQSMDIAAKEMSDTVYACVKVTDETGSQFYSDIVPYSPDSYAKGRLEKSTNKVLHELVKMMAIYGEKSKIYFS